MDDGVGGGGDGISGASHLFSWKRLFVISGALVGLVLVAILAQSVAQSRSQQPTQSQNSQTQTTEIAPKADTFVPFQSEPVNLSFEQTPIKISPSVSKDFSISEIGNIDDIEKAYGVTFSEDDLAQLRKNKFVMKNLLDTNIATTGIKVYENTREFIQLYKSVVGNQDYKERTQANSVFITSDVLMNLFSILSVDLMKETENKYLSPQVKHSTAKLYQDASAKLSAATSDAERKEWVKIRNYFAVPYALLSTAAPLFTADDYWNSDRSKSVDEFQAEHDQKDATIDSYENTIAFVKNMHLDSESERAVLADLKKVYDASENSLPDVFAQEYLNIPGDIQFKIPFSIFKVRGTYTSSSLRRQYFRAVQWYQQIPFLMGSPELTKYSLDIGGLMNENSDLLKQYNSALELLSALVGKSDDLDVSDFAGAVKDLGSSANDSEALNKYLDNRKPQSKIKALPAYYPTVGEVSLEDVMKATRGMRFFSQKFTPDSYWTGQLTQGDEKPAVNGLKLPGQTSSLEVMTILGSTFARTSLAKLPFYSEYKKAVDTKISELEKEADTWGESYWKSNQYTGIMWSIAGLFSWLQENRGSAPQFMQSPLWDAKTLLTGSAFWAELRHTNILYAKQSFAEKGGGGDDWCDKRPVPPAPKGYVEPQPEAYDRLYYTAQLLLAEYQARGFDLQNLNQLKEYISLLDVIREYTKLELENAKFTENTLDKSRTLYGGENCTESFISEDSAVKARSTDSNTYSWTPWYPDGESRDYRIVAVSKWEELRKEIVNRLGRALPRPIEGPILPIKDKRAAVIADVHTSKEGILEEGTGVPRVIFVAVKDANGARLTVGFTYSHYEFLSDKDRFTDEEWQKKFYDDSKADNYTITYLPKLSWPSIPTWYQSLLGTK